MSKPAYDGCDQLRAHGRVGRNVDSLGHSRHGARNDEVALHAFGGSFERDDIVEADHACLGHAVIHDAMVAVQSADRRSQHDATVTRRAHERKRWPDDVERAAEMHIQNGIEVFVRHLLQ